MLPIKLNIINYWAVLVAAAATFMLGAVWYTALFGEKRTGLLNFTEVQMKQAESAAPVTFSLLFVCYLVVAFVMAMVFSVLGVDSAVTGAMWGALLWVGLAAAIGLTGNITTAIPLGVFLIDASYQLVFLAMTGAILGAWQK